MKTVARVVALVLLAVATGYALERWVVHPLRCSRAASFGAAALEAAESRAAALNIRAELESCTCVSPPDAIIPVARGAAAMVEGDARRAVAEYQRALAIDRRPEIYFQLGLAQLEARDRAAGIESLARACAFDPARLADIADADVRREVRQRLALAYGRDWVR